MTSALGVNALRARARHIQAWRKLPGPKPEKKKNINLYAMVGKKIVNTIDCTVPSRSFRKVPGE
jgi:hypothetical protein